MENKVIYPDFDSYHLTCCGTPVRHAIDEYKDTIFCTKCGKIKSVQDSSMSRNERFFHLSQKWNKTPLPDFESYQLTCSVCGGKVDHIKGWDCDTLHCPKCDRKEVVHRNTPLERNERIFFAVQRWHRGEYNKE